MRLVSAILVFLAIVSCKSRKDDTREIAVMNYVLNCPGGTEKTCTDICARDKCGLPIGSAVTASTLSCVNTCQSGCSSYCNLTSIIMLYMNE